MRDEKHLELMIETLLADPENEGNPLRYALEELYAEYRSLLHQIDRIMRISDRYQSVGREQKESITGRYHKQLRQLEKIARISDRYQSMMRDLNEALKDASTKDALTGIGNRRMLMEHLKAETARADRLEHALTVVLVDVDRFKAVNDAYGHEAGDKVLMRIANAIRDGVRDYDLCGRWGGEEFMIIMPEAAADDGAHVVERMRLAIAEIEMIADGEPVRISASFGIAQRRRGEHISDTINRADAALFDAKRNGRNRYEVAA